MAYNTIKWVLRSHIKSNLLTVWQWDVENKNFICTFGTIEDDLPIYTAQQLLDVLLDLKD